MSQVLLEVLTGRRALQCDRRSRDTYLVRTHSVRQTNRQTGSGIGLIGCWLFCCCRRSWWRRWKKRRTGGSSWTAGWSQVSHAFILHILVVPTAAAASSFHLLCPENSTVPPRSMEVVTLACMCLDRNRKKRPAMTDVRHTVHNRFEKVHLKIVFIFIFFLLPPILLHLLHHPGVWEASGV